MSHLKHHSDTAWNVVPGYISLVNLVYSITEYFEFATRICQAGVYRGNLDISLDLNGVKGHLLTTDWMLRQHCAASEDHLSKTWHISSEGLIASSSEHSLKAIVWLCECFGWMSPNVEAIKRDQAKLLSGRL